MLGASSLGVAFQIVLCLIIIKGCLTTTSLQEQKECHNANVILNCPHFTKNIQSKLTWRFNDTVHGRWIEVASIKHGFSKLSSSNSSLDGRLNIHPNGSLEISSLKSQDETQYMCIVKNRHRKLHFIKLSVSCGKVTRTERKVCVEEDVVLDCESKHRSNPTKINEVKWHKKKGSDEAWVLLVGSSGSDATTGGRFEIHGNSSLILPQGRSESEDSYRCDVTKKENEQRDRHIIVVKNVKCRNEKLKTAKTTTGRVAMTTPIKGTQVAMETSTSPSTKQTSGITSSMSHVTSSANIKTTNGRAAIATAIPIKRTEVAMETSTSTSTEQTQGITSSMSHVTSSANIKTTNGHAAITTAIPIKRTEVAVETSTTASIEQTTSKATSRDHVTSTASSSTSKSESVTRPDVSTTQSTIVCGGVLRDLIGSFQSPNFPSAYPANSHCKWTISVPKDYAAIDITFEHLHLEHDDNCGSDYISVLDELSNRVGCRYCGMQNSPLKIQVRGRLAVVVFRSDSSVQKTGFKLNYKGVKTVAEQEP